MSSSEILAAIRDLQTHFEGQFHATNKAIQELHKSTDLWFDALQAGPLPARSGSHGSFQRPPSPAEALSPGSSPAFRSDGSSSVPQRHRGLHFLSVDVTSAAASTSLAAASTSAAASFSAAPPPSASPVPPPSAVVSPPSPPSSAASPSPSAIAIPPSADSPLTLGSGVVLNRAEFAAPPPFLSPTTVLAPPPAALLPVELFGKDPGPAPPPPTHVVTPPPNIHLRPLPPPTPPTAPSTSPSPTKAAMFSLPATTSPKFSNLIVLAHNIEVGRILEISLWPSPSDMEAQSNPFNKYQDVATVASRRGVIFSLYALEEVYKDSLESPP